MHLISHINLGTEPRASSSGSVTPSMLTVVPVVGMVGRMVYPGGIVGRHTGRHVYPPCTP